MWAERERERVNTCSSEVMGHLSTPCNQQNVNLTSIGENEDNFFASSSLRRRLRSARPSSTSRSISARIRGLSRKRITDAAIFLRAPWKHKIFFICWRKRNHYLCHPHFLQLLFIECQELAVAERHHDVGVPGRRKCQVYLAGGKMWHWTKKVSSGLQAVAGWIS